MSSSRIRRGGQVFRVDPKNIDTTDTKHRRYVLLEDCEGEVGSAALAYTSTQDTERREGAEAQTVHGSWMGIRDCGFTKRVLVYTSRIVPIPRQYLASSTGNTGKCWEKIKESLGRALGLGKGTALEGSAKGSLRGRIVEFTPAFSAKVYTPFGVLITEPEYSKKLRYQIAIPLYADPPRLRDGDLIVAGEPWMQTMLKAGKSPEKILVEPRLLRTIYYGREVSRPLSAVIDPVSLASIESEIRRHFAL